MIQPQIVLLKEGTDTSQGAGQLISNINACCAVADILRTTLGPMGMDKLIRDGETVSISNDGATILSLLNVVHPAAKTLSQIATSQDEEVGDGTTTVVLLASELLQLSKEFIEDGVAPQLIIRGYRLACQKALKSLDSLAFSPETLPPAILRGEPPEVFALKQIAKTSLNSKLIEGEKDFFAEMLVRAFLDLREEGGTCAKDFLSIKSVPGGSVKESFLVRGVAFKKTFSYAGFEQQPKKFDNPAIALLNVELELKTEHISGEVRVSPQDYQSIVDAEWKILYDKLDFISRSGAKIVLSKLPIGDLATQYFAEKRMFCAGRVPDSDLQRLAAMSGGAVQSSLKDLGAPGVLGSCTRFEEKQVGQERYNFFIRAESKSIFKRYSTLILRGGSEQYIAESTRSLHDAMMAIVSAARSPRMVAGGGAVEMELSRAIKDHSSTLPDAHSFFVASFARALEAIPRALAVNAGLDATDTLSALRRRHAEGETNAGVDVLEGGAQNSFESFVWEPLASKRNAISAAAEAACLVLSVDETIQAPGREQQPPSMPGGPMAGV